MFSAGRAGVDAGFKQGLKAALHSALVKEWTPVGPTEEDAMVLSSGKPTTDRAPSSWRLTLETARVHAPE